MQETDYWEGSSKIPLKNFIDALIEAGYYIDMIIPTFYLGEGTKLERAILIYHRINVAFHD